MRDSPAILRDLSQGFMLMGVAVILSGIVFKALPAAQYPYSQLINYPSIDIPRSKLVIERFETYRSRIFRPRTTYYELAVYFEPDARFFIRDPHLSNLEKIKRKLNEDSNISLQHLPQTERGRGYRIVNLRNDAHTVYSFAEYVSNQKKTDSVIMFAGFSMLLLSLLFNIIRRLHFPVNA